ncbi:hypothetical protein FTO68_05950 [Methanocalculus taiwanensis]|uniref:Uncharacterized protein n=1 Tax=Methanocalculus taiwanensis TaxID=106207 RepID=A0ABD4THV7_9EURY|nr:hypothetical protein [Methanocalculus taiwanensis]MCQ1538528.1 hypothetical protein [Methanocalculus taiwanensis]
MEAREYEYPEREFGPPPEDPDEIALVELKLLNVIQLFNTLDPSPFYEKELDTDAEEYIYDSFEEIPFDQPVRIIVYLPLALISNEVKENIKKAVENHFLYLGSLAEHALSVQWRRERLNLAIGIVFLFFCLTISQHASDIFEQGSLAELIAESLIIIGWVALWKPVQFFLYDLWPIRKRRRLCEKIAVSDLVVKPALA